ncbi:Yif1 family protein, partial [Kipferlia bialata]
APSQPTQGFVPAPSLPQPAPVPTTVAPEASQDDDMSFMAPVVASATSLAATQNAQREIGQRGALPSMSGASSLPRMPSMNTPMQGMPSMGGMMDQGMPGIMQPRQSTLQPQSQKARTVPRRGLGGGTRGSAPVHASPLGGVGGGLPPMPLGGDTMPSSGMEYANAVVGMVPGADNAAVKAVTQMGLQYGQQVMHQTESKVKRFLRVDSLSYYFSVNNRYVGRKLAMLTCPYLPSHTWNRQTVQPEVSHIPGMSH